MFGVASSDLEYLNQFTFEVFVPVNNDVCVIKSKDSGFLVGVGLHPETKQIETVTKEYKK
jgi:hypothetical protein